MTTGFVHIDQRLLTISYRGARQFLSGGGITFLTQEQLADAFELHLVDSVQRASAKRYPQASLAEISSKNNWPILSVQQIVERGWKTIYPSLTDDYSADGPSEFVLTEDGYLVKICSSLGLVSPCDPNNPVVLSVDYGQSFKVMVSSGNYERVDYYCTERAFPIIGSGVDEVEACLIHPNCSTSSDESLKFVLEADMSNPWQPAKIEHILAFGARYRSKQRRYPIIGLGHYDKARSAYSSPMLVGEHIRRSLDVSGGQCNGSCRYLAVRPRKIVT